MGRIFRALHTIKGSGAMFGFDELAAFTHNLETAFDEVRNGRLAITPELIDLTLAALDQIRAMLEEGAGRRTPVRRFWPRCGILAGVPANQPAGPVPEAPPPMLVGNGPEAQWRIRFAPGPDLMRNGANPLLLLRELGQLGGLSVTADMARGSAARRTGPGALLRALGDGAGHRGRARTRSAMSSSLSKTVAS